MTEYEVEICLKALQEQIDQDTKAIEKLTDIVMMQDRRIAALAAAPREGGAR